MARGHSRSTDQGEALRPLGRAWIRAFASGRRVRSNVSPSDSEGTTSQRGWVDVSAAWNRWHAAGIAAGFSPRERPFFALFDRVRVERLATKGWPGMASNLADSERLAPSLVLLRPLYLCARHLAAGDKNAARMYVENWIRQHKPSPIRARLLIWRRALGAAPEPQCLGHAEFEALKSVLRELLQLDTWQHGVLEDATAFSEKIASLVKFCGQNLGAWIQDSNCQKEAANHTVRSFLDVDSGEEDPDSDLTLDGKTESEAPSARAYPGYTVYNHADDETAPAARWYQPIDKQHLEHIKGLDCRRARQLAHRLQRRLQVARRRTWQFDQEEGMIDSRRLARLVQGKPDSRVFRCESERQVPEACVSLLVDMSGSMKSDRRLSAALAIDLAVHVLEISGIQCEVLGFTTRYGENNPVERRWQRSGRSGRPGRLNALRHIIFKSARQPWRRCRPHLGLLLRDGFGHENIDGESLHWAAQRLFSREVQRRILMVLSDGAPFDQATASANGREFLCDHLRTVVRRLDALPLHLLALGTGADVSRFYRQAVVLKDPEAVAETLFERLGDLLTSPKAQRDSR